MTSPPYMGGFYELAVTLHPSNKIRLSTVFSSSPAEQIQGSHLRYFHIRLDEFCFLRSAHNSRERQRPCRVCHLSMIALVGLVDTVFLTSNHIRFTHVRIIAPLWQSPFYFEEILFSVKQSKYFLRSGWKLAHWDIMTFSSCQQLAIFWWKLTGNLLVWALSWPSSMSSLKKEELPLQA